MECPQQEPRDEAEDGGDVDPVTPEATLSDTNNFILNVSQFFNQEALSDVIIKINDLKPFFAHKFVLAKSSEVFKTMLYNRSWKQQDCAGEGEPAESVEAPDTPVPTLELQETAECAAVFEKFLRYLYTAEVQINTTSAVGILCLADKYNVNSLKELCTQYMCQHSRSPKVSNALNWYSWGKALHMTSLIQQCTKTIAWNAQEIIGLENWEQMEEEFVVDILVSSELVVRNEFTLFIQVAKWLLHPAHQDGFKERCDRLLPLLRFPQMLVPQLHELEQHELSQRVESKELLKTLINKAYRFRALCPTQVDVKIYRGPVPTEVRDAEWKITYRKQGDAWMLQLYCHETALVQNEARFQTSILIYNSQEKVIQVQQEETCVLTRGNSLTTQIQIAEPPLARNMAILIKPVPQ